MLLYRHGAKNYAEIILVLWREKVPDKPEETLYFQEVLFVKLALHGNNAIHAFLIYFNLLR